MIMLEQVEACVGVEHLTADFFSEKLEEVLEISTLSQQPDVNKIVNLQPFYA